MSCLCWSAPSTILILIFMAQIAGRLVLGFAVSLSAIGECIYISEIAPPVRFSTSPSSYKPKGINKGEVMSYYLY